MIMMLPLLLLLLVLVVLLPVVVEAKQATLVAILCFIKPKIISWHQKSKKLQLPAKWQTSNSQSAAQLATKWPNSNNNNTSNSNKKKNNKHTLSNYNGPSGV